MGNDGPVILSGESYGKIVAVGSWMSANSIIAGRKIGNCYEERRAWTVRTEFEERTGTYQKRRKIMNEQLDKTKLNQISENRAESENYEEPDSTAELTMDNEAALGQSGKSLMDEILEYDNLDESLAKVRNIGGLPGVDGMDVKKDLPSYFKANEEEIVQRIKTRKYKPKPLLIVKTNGKSEEQKIPIALDRVIQQAMVQKIAPIYTQTFSEKSMGFRDEEDKIKAVERIEMYVNEGYHYALYFSLLDFFDTVTQMKLISLLQTTIEDNDVISLIHKFLAIRVLRDGKVERTKVGIPREGPLSPLLADIYLDQLDQELEERGHRFVRYEDNVIILLKSQKATRRVLENLTRFIERELWLKVDSEKTVTADITEIHYLGYGFHYNPETKVYQYQKSSNSHD